MTRKRLISSKIRESQSFATLTYRQRDLWQGIIVKADDQGRLPGVAAYVRAAVWPYDDVSLEEVEGDLSTLINLDYIAEYLVGSGRYFQIINWWKYQKQQWPTASDYPPPHGWVDRCRYHAAGNKIIKDNWERQGGYMEEGGNLPRTLPSDQGSELPSGQGRATKEDKDKEKGSEEDKRERSRRRSRNDEQRQAASSAALDVWKEITTQCAYPGTEKPLIEPALIAMMKEHGDKTVEYLTPFWNEWVKVCRYSSKNGAWLYDCAIAGQMPERKNGDPWAAERRRAEVNKERMA